jgi:hypothetical protein
MFERDMSIFDHDARKTILRQNYLIFQKKKKKGARNRFTVTKPNAFYGLSRKRQTFLLSKLITNVSNIKWILVVVALMKSNK